MQPVRASEGRIGNGDRVNLKLRNFHENFGTARNQLAWLLHHNERNDDANGNPDPECDPDRQFGNRVGDSARDPGPLHEGHLDETPVTPPVLYAALPGPAPICASRGWGSSTASGAASASCVSVC